MSQSARGSSHPILLSSRTADELALVEPHFYAGDTQLVGEAASGIRILRRVGQE